MTRTTLDTSVLHMAQDLLEVAEAASRYRQTVRDGELATGRRQRHDADALDDALARLEAAK